MKNDAPQVSLWAWYPNMANVVDNFNDNHTDVQVCWTNAGQGQDEYAKLQTAIAAKKGPADVVMLEADRLVSFAIQDALVDLAPFGADDVKGNFSEGAWKDVSQGDKVFAIPVDGGPMALIYRTDVFEKYGITPPTTWDEYAAAAQKVKAAGGPVLRRLRQQRAGGVHRPDDPEGRRARSSTTPRSRRTSPSSSTTRPPRTS